MEEVRETGPATDETATLHGMAALPAAAAAALPARTIFLWCELARAAATANGYPARRADRAAEAAAAACWLTLAAVIAAPPRGGGEAVGVDGLASRQAGG